MRKEIDRAGVALPEELVAHVPESTVALEALANAALIIVAQDILTNLVRPVIAEDGRGSACGLSEGVCHKVFWNF